MLWFCSRAVVLVLKVCWRALERLFSAVGQAGVRGDHSGVGGAVRTGTDSRKDVRRIPCIPQIPEDLGTGWWQEEHRVFRMGLSVDGLGIKEKEGRSGTWTRGTLCDTSE